MATVDLTEYRRMLEADPEAPNEGPWYAKSVVQHDGATYAAGRRLPTLKNSEVSQLLEVNAVTSVNPNPQQDQGQSAGVDESQGGQAGNAGTPPSGTTRLDENGNPVQ